MAVYLDVIWLLNFLIDFMLLKLTAIMMKRRVRSWRLWSGALFASSIILLLFTPLSPIFYHPIGKIFFSMVIILIAFGFGRWSVFIQNVLAFYFSAFAIGGGLFAVHYFFQSNSSYAGSGLLNTLSFGDPISWGMVLIGFPILWYFSKKRLDHVVVRKWQGTTQAQVTIEFFDRTIRSTGMIDSGNKLYEPLTRIPVMFLSREACADALPSALFHHEGGFQSLLEDETLPDEWKSRVAMIPYRGVDGSRQWITAVRPDRVVIQHEGRKIESPKIFVALTGHRLSGADDFDSILHPDMLIHGKMIIPAS